MTRHLTVFLFLFCCAALLPSATLRAQEESTAPLSQTAPTTPTTASLATAVTTESISQLSAEISEPLKRAQADLESSPDSTTVSQVLEILTGATELLQSHQQYTSATLEHDKAIREAPAQMELLQRALEADDTSTTAVDIPTTASVDYVSQLLEEKRADLDLVLSREREISTEIQRRETRLEQIPKEMTDARRLLGEAQVALNAQDGTDEPAVVAARKLHARAQIQASLARLESLEREQQRYAARDRLFPLATEVVANHKASLDTEIIQIEKSLSEIRVRAAEDSAREIERAARQAVNAHPIVLSVAEENTSLSQTFNVSRIIEKENQATELLRSVESTSRTIADQYENLRSRFDAVGYSNALGEILRRQRDLLPSTRTYRVMIDERISALEEANLAILQIQDAQHPLSDLSARARQLTIDYVGDADTTVSQEVRRELSRLLQVRRDFLAQARAEYEKYFRTMLRLNAAQTDLVTLLGQYRSFIDERILWLPSTGRVSIQSVPLAGQSALDLVSLPLWRQYVEQLFQRHSFGLPVIFGCALMLLLLFYARARWKRKLRHVVDEAARNRLDSFRRLLLALLYAAITVLPLPLILVIASWPMAGAYNIPIEIASLANGLLWSGLALYCLLFARAIIRPRGIAEIFFNWPPVSLAKVRKALWVVLWVYIPAVMIVRIYDVSQVAGQVELVRFALAVAMFIISALSFQLLRPTGTVLSGLDSYRSSTWLYRFRYIIVFMVVIVPFGLGVGALLGYVYTVAELSKRLSATVWLGGAVVLLNEVIFFWILVKRRRLALEEARRRRETARQKAAEDGDTSQVEVATSFSEPALDIAAISHQAGRLLRTFVLALFVIGAWITWADVLPALRYLDTQALWHVSEQVTETVASTGATITREIPVAVTLADVMLAILIGMIAIAAIRNIPGLLDITYYQKFGVQSGERYAINTIIRYVITLSSMIFILSQLGLQWRNIQWLAAAMTVGLGFGLQEIFANFVSGLILLFERPVRVGDIVTVGNVTGRVTQIRIRAITIINWDHQENIIPNKELITGQVLNWTLSNLMVRIVIDLSVAYGSDYDKIREILLRLARENQYTLDDPAPIAIIDRFAASTVDCKLIVHLPNMDNRVDVRNELIARIDHEFVKAGIVMPVPTMNVRLEKVDGKNPTGGSAPTSVNDLP